MKWQTIALILISAITIGGTVTYTDLFGGLFHLNGMNYTYSGDTSCADICESYINVTTSYWAVCFEHNNRSDILYKKSALSRTLWVNLNNVTSIVSTEPEVDVDWLVPTVGKDNWRSVKDGDCWNRGKVNRIKIVAHKDKEQTIKWGFRMSDGKTSYIEIDPKWEGITDKMITKHTFTKDTEITEYIDRTGIATKYPDQIFADSKGTKIHEAKSLKNCEFCDSLKFEIDLDPAFNFTIEDYNYTDYTNVCFMSNQTGDIPLRINLLTNKSEKVLDYRIKTTKQQVNQWRCYNFTVPSTILNYEIEWGWNSSNVRINSTIGGVKSYWYNDANWMMGSIIKWNITELPASQTIENVLFTFYTRAKTGSPDNDTRIWRIQNQTWSTFAQALLSLRTNQTSTTFNGVANQWSKINITPLFVNDYQQNNKFFTLNFEDPDALTSAAPYSYDTAAWYQGDAGGTYFTFEDPADTGWTGNIPFLNITYSSGTDTTKPSFSTIPYNSSTTNQSAIITWTPSESANYTLRYTNSSDYKLGTLISNATSLSTQRDVSLSLTNFTRYYINVSIWDTAGNYNQSNFSFRTTQTVPIDAVSPTFQALITAGDPQQDSFGSDIPKYFYYRNATWQTNNWIYISANFTDDIRMDKVLVEWRNSSGRYNLTMQNTSRTYYLNITNQANWTGYTFDLIANDTSNNRYRYNWTFFDYEASWGAPETYRKYIGLGDTARTFSNVQLYLTNATYNNSMIDDRILTYEQATDGIITDTGYLKSAKPTKSNIIYCAAFTGVYIGETYPVSTNTRIDNIYLHVWWANNDNTSNFEFAVLKNNQSELNYDIGLTNAYNTNAGLSKVNATVGAGLQYGTYFLEANYWNFTEDLFADANDINLVLLRGTTSLHNPAMLSTSNYTSFVIWNLPSNATLQAADTDSDGVNDWQELFNVSFYTDPRNQDTDGDGMPDSYDCKPNLPYNATNCTTSAVNPCACPSPAANWNIPCNSCPSIPTCDLAGNNVYLEGTGTTELGGHIYNVKNLYIQDTCDFTLNSDYDIYFMKN